MHVTRKILLYLLLFIACVSHVSLDGQDRWLNSEVTIVGPFYSLIEECGDTILDGKTYERLRVASVQTSMPDQLSWRDCGYVRFSGDSVLLRVFFQGMITPELTLYDYGVTEGDTMGIGYLWHEEFVVSDVSSIFLLGETRRVIELTHRVHGYPDVWIEGIGSVINGLLYPGAPPPELLADAGWVFISYYSHLQDTVWSYNDSLQCFLDEIPMTCPQSTGVSSTRGSNLDLQLAPNPMHSRVTLQGLPTGTACAVFNTHGQRVGVLAHGGIETSHWAPGVYYFIVELPDGKRKVLKGIKT